MNLGKELKKARKEKGLTIDELQKRTKIRKKYLIALEKSNFSEIKGEVYVKSFIKGYAKAIGINPDPFIYEYEQHISDKKSDNNKINNENKDKSFFENNVFKKIGKYITSLSASSTCSFVYDISGFDLVRIKSSYRLAKL